MLEPVSPTRMNLLNKKAQIRLATQGAELLKNKRDALLQEFMRLLGTVAQFRSQLQNHLAVASRQLLKARALDGVQVLRSVSLATRRELDIEIKERNLWGIRVPEITPIELRRSPLSRGYSPTSVSARIDETVEEFEKALNLIVSQAPVEVKLKRLGEEIRKTSRRVNALEQRVIPQLIDEANFIRQSLEERAREDVFRLKRLKTKRLRSAQSKSTG